MTPTTTRPAILRQGSRNGDGDYEIPKYEGDLQPPNLYVPLEREVLDRKLGLLRRRFVSQQEKPWYDDATFLGLMRLHGVERRASEGYAEAFHASKHDPGLIGNVTA